MWLPPRAAGWSPRSIRVQAEGHEHLRGFTAVSLDLRHAVPPHGEIAQLQLSAAGSRRGRGVSLARDVRMDITTIDYESLMRYIASRFEHAPPEGPVVGRTAVRDAGAERLECSQLEAEQVVDTLVVRGRIALVQLPDGRGVWRWS